MSKGSSPMVILGAIGFVLFAAMGAGVYFFAQSMIGGVERRGPVASLLDSPAVIQPALEEEIDEEVLANARKLTVDRNTAMLLSEVDGVAHRIQVSRSGSVLRRGGATRVAAEPFDVRRVDLSVIPRVVADASQRTGGQPREVVLGRDQDARLLWRAVPSDSYYAEDGTHLPDPFGLGQAADDGAPAEEPTGDAHDPLVLKVCAAYEEVAEEGVASDVLLQTVAVRAVSSHGVTEAQLAELGARPEQLLASIRSRGEPPTCAGFVAELEARSR